ncbi:FkbM family methyltransferase [Actinosynnema sp. NPDC059335]|uniref:FkbM family methyltransferase n=1 Tax=Actinosynnema sp. NPDC059335 TaxID=3346804 RepID=UPI00366D9126
MPTLTTPAGLLRFQDDDRVIAPHVAATGTWEPDEADRITELLWARPGWFVDLGAHVGYHSAVQLARLSNIQVLAVEANPTVGRLLADNLRSWGRRARVLCCAAWCDSTSTLTVRQHEAGNGGDWRVGHRRGHDELLVPCIKVDDLAHTYIGREGRVSVIKSDLQGRDHIALHGATGTLALDRPDVLAEFDTAMIRDAPRVDWVRTPLDVAAWYQRMHYVLRAVDGTVFEHPVELVNYSTEQPGGTTTVWLQPTERAGR